MFQRTKNPVPVTVRAFVYPAGTIFRADDLIDDPPWSPTAGEEDPLEDVAWEDIPEKERWHFEHSRRDDALVVPGMDQAPPQIVRARHDVVMWEFDVIEDLFVEPGYGSTGPVEEHFRESHRDIMRFYPDLYKLVQEIRNPPPAIPPPISGNIFSMMVEVVSKPAKERSPYDSPDTVQFVAVFDAEVWSSGPDMEGDYDAGVDLELMGQLDFSKLGTALVTPSE